MPFARFGCLVVVSVLGGCRPNAPTVTPPSSPSRPAPASNDDAEIGAATDRELLAQIPVYSDAALTAYVTSVADRVGAQAKGGPKNGPHAFSIRPT